MWCKEHVLNVTVHQRVRRLNLVCIVLFCEGKSLRSFVQGVIPDPSTINFCYPESLNMEAMRFSETLVWGQGILTSTARDCCPGMV